MKTILDWQHPELREGEMFLTNSTEEEYGRIRWMTKRIGEVAYNIRGEVIDSIDKLFPVFVQKQEYEEGMKEHA